jgi:uncharacterized protein YeaO (DUF488 family)
MAIAIKRAYDAPEPEDGYRVLVDRVWPRGVTREALRLDEWARELAPSTALRKWFGHDPEKWPEFRRRYMEELGSAAPADVLARLASRAASGPVTLVYSARDTAHNQARVLADVLASTAT